MDKEKYIGQSKMTEEPKKPLSFKLGDKVVKTKHIDDDAVTTPKIKDKQVTPSKVSDDFQQTVVSPLTTGLDRKYNTITSNLDSKYRNITDELYSMIASLQVGGIALSQKYGERTDIGISQKTLTKTLGTILEELEEITGKHYFEFTMELSQDTIYSEAPTVPITVTVDASDAFGDFDAVQVLVDGQVVAESSDVEVFTTTIEISHSSVVSAQGTILGSTNMKQETVTKEIPFFMGGGETYQDIMTEEYRKELEGTLEGDYDLVVKQNGQHMFIIIPESRKAEFRRVNMKTPDMSGFEIPLDLIFENEDYVVYKSKAPDGYLAGTYNVDININS